MGKPNKGTTFRALCREYRVQFGFRKGEQLSNEVVCKIERGLQNAQVRHGELSGIHQTTLK